MWVVKRGLNPIKRKIRMNIAGEKSIEIWRYLCTNTKAVRVESSFTLGLSTFI